MLVKVASWLYALARCDGAGRGCGAEKTNTRCMAWSDECRTRNSSAGRGIGSGIGSKGCANALVRSQFSHMVLRLIQ